MPGPSYPCDPESTWSVPDRLPRLEPGTHVRSNGRMNVSEAATWLAGEESSDRPLAVHPAIACLMRSIAVYPDEATAVLWPLLLASVGSASGHPRPILWIRGVRARVKVRRNPSHAVDAWRTLVRRREMALDKKSSGPSRRRLASALVRMCKLPASGPRKGGDVWIDTFSY